jgi:predicted  nucleic acid-binding Zn-ribbon protein
MKRCLTLLSFCLAAQAQTPASEPQTIQALLVEVRQLRLALERSTLIGPRIQIAVERLKLQQEHVARITRQLEEVRRDLEQRHAEQPRIQQQLQSIESKAGQSIDPKERRDLEEGLKIFKLEAEQAEKAEQQLRAKEGELTGQLQSEQSRLTELNDRLNQIERALTVP